MGLPHRDRDPRCPATVQLAKTRVAIALGILFDVLVPQDLKRDVLALQLAVNRWPIGLGATAVPLLLSGCSEELPFEHRVGHVGWQCALLGVARSSVYRPPRPAN